MKRQNEIKLDETPAPTADVIRCYEDEPAPSSAFIRVFYTRDYRTPNASLIDASSSPRPQAFSLAVTLRGSISLL